MFVINHIVSTSEGTGKLDPKYVLWLMPVAFIIHDGEELLTMPGWIDGHRAELDHFAAQSAAAAELISSLPATTGQAAIAIGSLSILFVAVTAAAVSGKGGSWLYVYAALLGAFSLHVFTHLAQAAYFAGYTPGVVTAVVVIIPAAVYIYKRLFEEKLLTPKSAAVTAIVGFVLFIPGALLAQQLGSMFAVR